MSITVTIETVSYSLGEFVRKVLGDYSDNYPNKVVRPNQLTCFVMEKKMDRIYYYPVNSIATRSDVRYLIRRNFPSYNVTVADFNINLYSYCQNPLGVQTPVTGAVLVEYEVNGKK